MGAHVLPDPGRCLVYCDVDAEEGDLIAVGRVRGLDPGQQRLAQLAPGRPPLEHHRLLSEVAAQVDRFPLEVVHRHRRRDGTDRDAALALSGYRASREHPKPERYRRQAAGPATPVRHDTLPIWTK